MNEESITEIIDRAMHSHSSSEEETKMIGSGDKQFNDTISSTSSEWAALCQRCSSEDACLVCINCGNIYLCTSCDDIIHSLGVFESHKRVNVSEFEPESTTETDNINAEIKVAMNPHPEWLTQESKEVRERLQSKLSYFSSKNTEWESSLKHLKSKEIELEMNYEVSLDNIGKSIEYLKWILNNKETQLKSEISVIKSNNINDLEAQKLNIQNLKKKIEGICQVLKEGISQPVFVCESGHKFIDKRIEIWEGFISTDLSNQEEIESWMPKIVDLSPLNSIFSMISLETSKEKVENEEIKIEKRIDDTDELLDEDSKTEEIKVGSRPQNYKGSSLSMAKEKYVLKDTKARVANYPSTAETPNLIKNRSRKFGKKGETKPLKRTLSSYGGNKDFERENEKGLTRGISTNSSKQKLFTHVEGLKDINWLNSHLPKFN